MRIRTLGHYAPATLKQILQLTHLTEQMSEKNNSDGFIKESCWVTASILLSTREHKLIG